MYSGGYVEKRVTASDMQRVNIEPGWLMREFFRYVFELDTSKATLSDLKDTATNEIGEEFGKALMEFDALVAQKNKQYQDAWQQDGPVTALTDLKDKLYRLDSASKDGAILKWDADKLRGTFFDILVRTLMCMAWFGANFQDDDDDRSVK